MSELAPDSQAFSIPYVIEKTGRGERTYDLYSRLMEDRIIFIGTEVNDMVANVVVAQLLFLHKQNKTQDVQVYINTFSVCTYLFCGLELLNTKVIFFKLM